MHDPGTTVPADRPILVTGATGYIGGRLVPRLLELGYRVRCMVRDPERLQGRPWLGDVAHGVIPTDRATLRTRQPDHHQE